MSDATTSNGTPRGKRWYRPRNIILLLVVLAIARVAWQIYLAVNPTPGSAINYQHELYKLAVAQQPAPPDATNSWASLVEIGDMLEQVRAEYDAAHAGDDAFVGIHFEAIYLPDEEYKERWPGAGARGSPAPDQASGAADAGAALGLLRDRGLFVRTAALAQAPLIVRPEGTGPVWETLLPELSNVRNLARAQHARMHIAAGEHDELQFLAALRETIALGSITAHQPFLIDRNVGQRIIRETLRTVRTEVASGVLTPSTCRRAIEIISAGALVPSLSYHVRAERLAELDFVQLTHTAPGLGGGRRIITKVAEIRGTVITFGSPVVTSKRPTRLANLAGVFMPSRNQVEAVVNSYFDDLAGAADLAGAQRDAALASIKQRKAVVEQSDAYYSLVLVDIGQSVEFDDRLAAEVAGTNLMLAIELFHDANRRWPTTLDELTPGTVPTLGVDPFSADGRFVYRPLTDGATPRPYLLYSVGPDRADNDGHPPSAETGWRDPKPGAGDDIIIHDPRSGASS